MQHNATQHRGMQHSATQHRGMQHSGMQRSATQHRGMQHSATQHSATHRSGTQCNALVCRPASCGALSVGRGASVSGKLHINMCMGTSGDSVNLSAKMTHRDNGGSGCTGEVLDHLPVGLLQRRGVRCSRGVRRMRLGRWRRGFRSRGIEEQFDAWFRAVFRAHVLPQARPPPGASRGPGHRPRCNLALEIRRAE